MSINVIYYKSVALLIQYMWIEKVDLEVWLWRLDWSVDKSSISRWVMIKKLFWSGKIYPMTGHITDYVIIEFITLNYRYYTLTFTSPNIV